MEFILKQQTDQNTKLELELRDIQTQMTAEKEEKVTLPDDETGLKEQAVLRQGLL